MSNIVLSGINLVEAGPLTIYKELLSELVKYGYTQNNHIVAFVHDKKLFEPSLQEKIEFIEIEKSKKSWLYRIFYEYVYFYFYSKKREIDLWFSVHDMTPTVKAKKRFVYCHNCTQFSKMRIKDGCKLFLFSRFYQYLYKINIKKNTAVIVQQDWMRQAFKEIYKINSIIVAKPGKEEKIELLPKQNDKRDTFTFIFASFPRSFKNFEIICEAAKILKQKGIENYKVILTIDGTENKYAANLIKKYKKIENLKFIGLQEREKLFKLYGQADAMVFPSKLETWGLPITEFKNTNRPIILADLPYAHETLGTYDKAIFFEPNNANQLADIMLGEIKQENNYQKHTAKPIEQPFAQNWEELFKLIF